MMTTCLLFNTLQVSLPLKIPTSFFSTQLLHVESSLKREAKEVMLLRLPHIEATLGFERKDF